MPLGCADSGNQLCVLPYQPNPIGYNMSLRRDMLIKLGALSLTPGGTNSNLLSNEECELFYRVSRFGAKMVYTPNAVLRHKIHPARATRRYLLDRFYWQGISDSPTLQIGEPSGYCAHVFKAYKTSPGIPYFLGWATWHRLKREPHREMMALTNICHILGTMREELALGTHSMVPGGGKLGK